MFSSTEEYMDSFIEPLIEETHQGLFSSIQTVHRAPTREIWSVDICKPRKDLYYNISFDRKRDAESYEPKFGDLIALTEVRPKRMDDLHRPRSPYLIGFVHTEGECDSEKMDIRASKSIVLGEYGYRRKYKKKRSLFVVYLTSMITNLRKWMALKSELDGNMNVINRVLQPDSTYSSSIIPLFCMGEDKGTYVHRLTFHNPLQIQESCSECLSEESNQAVKSIIENALSSFKLDTSQWDAVSSCVATGQCHHQNTVKLIWGPPGTGKTKTVASLLFVQLRIKCRTLTCAPTNIAVLGVTSRLISLVNHALEYDTYGLGDIVLFGNEKRMEIDDHEDLFDVFLDYRVYALSSCLAGWKHNVESMISLLEDPEEMYRLYLEERKKEKNKDDYEGEEEEDTSFGNWMVISNEGKDKGIHHQDSNDVDGKRIWRRKIVQTCKENKKSEKEDEEEEEEEERSKRKGKLECDKREEKDSSTRSNKENGEKVEEDEDLTTFEEFFMKRFKLIGNRVIFCIRDLYTHLPTAFISLEVVKKMIKALDLLKSVRTMYARAVEIKSLREVLNGVDEVGNTFKHFRNLSSSKTELVQILRFLTEIIHLPIFTSHNEIWSFCLQNACLIFCTASSSATLHTEGMRPLELLVIDEAAQLIECESTIPLQLSGLRHAILVGDERQPPAMVESEICQPAEFGRSLFERLVILGHKKHILNVQYRMHPSISSFPNREFYESKILDGPNVKEQAHERRLLRGSMYGSYSFINVSQGKEEFDGHSTKNLVEVAVVSKIVASLFKESKASKQKLRVGCISPYKAQVFALQEKLGQTYNTYFYPNFSVEVQSIDGFQGGEEDLIIISTVRCNGCGSVGFLSNRQRTNVALTRARHCLWILGDGATLINTGSVWKELVVDAKARDCFYDANDDKNLAQAVVGALVELNQLDTLLATDSPLFRNMRWKVCFSDEFMKSIYGIRNIGVRKDVFSILQRLSRGWHRHGDANVLKMGGTYSQLLELYPVNELLNLVWCVDIERESSMDIQVLKVWDVLPRAKILKLANRLDAMFGNYTIDKTNRCKCRSFQGYLAPCMRDRGSARAWPILVVWPQSAGEFGSTCDMARRLSRFGLSTVFLELASDEAEDRTEQHFTLRKSVPLLQTQTPQLFGYSTHFSSLPQFSPFSLTLILHDLHRRSAVLHQRRLSSAAPITYAALSTIPDYQHRHRNRSPFCHHIEERSDSVDRFGSITDSKIANVPVRLADACKKALAKMIIIDELPFSFVEGEGFKQFIEVVQPMWKPSGRLVMAKNCMLIYGEEKMALKQIVKHQRLCLTTDTWTSVQNLNYMCLTGHFIDDNWKYQKKILNFCVVPNHKGDTLGRMVEQCLLDWGIDKFLTVTVDNASSNSLLIAYLERKTKHRKTTILNHEFLHVRCSAHILNLIVREGLQEIDDPIGRVRNIVRYVRSSPSRMAEFWSCVEKEGITCRLKPCLDVSTRWNYTYFMLERALTYQKAFDRLCDDPSFKLNVREEEIDEAFDDVDGFEGMGRIIEIEKRKKKRGRGRKENVGPPTSSDWEKIKLYVKFLRVFYIATLKFSGSLYVTCNVFFDEMVLILQDIVKLCETDDSELHDMALGMREKFDKYWGDFDKINQMLMFAVVLDLRCKIGFFEYCFRNTLGYDKTVVGELTDNITNGITRLFEWYVKNNANSNVHSQEMHMQKETNMACKSELGKYLVEASEDDSDKFDVLRWWKLNSSKYPIVSQMARDVLAIPVSTVASESAFSTGGRVIDPYRSSLSPKTVEALICTQQWIRKPTKINIKEQLDELEQLDSVFKLRMVLYSAGSAICWLIDSTFGSIL
ncbi:hypothetical protein RHSIM_RhsimUnG0008700 [Rhododendron simsii]|uniref:Uncharacterized protein n=1 Tax=Rhododendron simsii TaxID=118357 RepID=A0A834L361_RHOSS|nr:hypothetical protein RHSIM_RhsimUnG0008700 [Rhododendron simsii]